MSAPRKHFVYRTYDETNRLLYVGITVDLLRRRAEHKQSSAWYPQMSTVRLTGPLDEQGARDIERQAVRTEGPLYNIHVPERMRRLRAHGAVVRAEMLRLLADGTPLDEAIRAAGQHADQVMPCPQRNEPFPAGGVA